MMSPTKVVSIVKRDASWTTHHQETDVVSDEHVLRLAAQVVQRIRARIKCMEMKDEDLAKFASFMRKE